MSKFEIGGSVHVNGRRSGGGQIYTIVGMNEKYLFLSWELMYGEYDTSAAVTVIPRDSPQITGNEEKHTCNCDYCEQRAAVL